VANHRFRLITWNIANRACCGDQVTEIHKHEPDIVALQEVATNSSKKLKAELKAELKAIGLGFARDSVPGRRSAMPARRYGELIASRWPLVTITNRAFGLPWPERLLSVVVTTPWGEIEVHTTHVPHGSGHHWTKIETLEAIYKGLARKATLPRILCGDFNTPQEERRHGQVVTWGQDMFSRGEVVVWKTWKGVPGIRWDAAERNILEGLREFDLCDAFRRANGYKCQGFSWYTREGKGRRFDHVFACQSLNTVKCSYLRRFLDKRRRVSLSDHAPMEAVFEPQLRMWRR
jgi:exonuclease III